MSHLRCPKCAAAYDLASLAGHERFTCGGCGAVLNVPRVAVPVVTPVVAPATPPRPAAPPAHAPAAAPPAAPARPTHARHAPAPSHAEHATPRRQHGPGPTTAEGAAGDASPERSKVPLIVGGVAVAALAIVGVIVMSSGTDEPPPPPLSGTSTPVGSTAAGTMGDPMQDAAAWKALPEAARAARTQQVLSDAEKIPPHALGPTHSFFSARGEEAAARTIAERVVAADPESSWAHEALGHVDVRDTIERCLTECEFADEVGTPEIEELKALRAKLSPGRRALWAAGEDAKRVQELVALVREAEKKLQNPYWYGVARWARLQRATHVMKDFPALHAAVGPHVIFVAVDVPKGSALADAPADKVADAQKVLDRQVTLFDAFYDGWMREIGVHLGFTRYGPENSDFDTLCKMQVFANEEAYHEYNKEIGAGALFARAYYSLEEPRFITTYEGDEEEKELTDTDQVQCHEATHQLVHFYTWDLSRKALSRRVEWLHCLHRPMWSNEGFAEFFSSYRIVGGKYQWMQPLDERLSQLWIFDQMLAKKQWETWKLREILETRHAGQAQTLAGARALPEDQGRAIGAMMNLFYAKAYSLVYFLWYAEENGKPKWRDRYIQYHKFEFVLRYRRDSQGREYGAPVMPADFRRIMGLEDDAKFAAFEKEWRDYEAKLVEQHRKPEWKALKTKLFGIYGIPE